MSKDKESEVLGGKRLFFKGCLISVTGGPGGLLPKIVEIPPLKGLLLAFSKLTFLIPPRRAFDDSLIIAELSTLVSLALLLEPIPLYDFFNDD